MNKQTKMHGFPYTAVFSQPSFRFFLIACFILAGNLDWFYPKVAYAKTTNSIQSEQYKDNPNQNENENEASEQSTQGPTIIILDSSNSMWGEIEGEDKMTLAKQAINDLLKQWPNHKSLGIMGFSGKSRKKNCRAIKMLYPVSPFDLDKAKESIETVNP
ncbi:MAG TPA: VWA domain-containing protein, partial [Thiothrix sp.]|nr:VWA domain-containing protein [Thiothrix sp.]